MRGIRRFVCVILVSVFVIGSVCQASGKSKNDKSYTVDEVRKILDVFLYKNHPEIRFGTSEYVSYLTDQLICLSDEKLKEHPQCGLILDYAGLYLSEIYSYVDVGSFEQYEMGKTDNYVTFKDKTIGELTREVQE